jgi:micrococcal nuclease
MYEYKAIVTEVYDGDTITANVDLGFNISIEEKFRLLNINSPELKGTEKADGLISRDRLREKILNKEVIIKTSKDKKEKYGRYLAEIYLGSENINEWLIVEGLAERKEY